MANYDEQTAGASPEATKSLLGELLTVIKMTTSSLNEIGGELHMQADRIFGSEPSPPAAERPADNAIKQSSIGATLEDAVRGLRSKLDRVSYGASRLRKVG